MNGLRHTRRSFLRKSARIAAIGVSTPYVFSASGLCGDMPRSKNDRPTFGCIGNGWMGNGRGAGSDLDAASRLGDVVAVCDVDRKHAEAAADGGKRTIYDDYRRLLDRKDIDAVTISTPDHWHAKMAIDAMHAGKDVYCQKPLTLTIDEGRKVCKTVKETGRVLQAGTQQRSEYDERFLKAVAMCRLGRIGKIHRVTCSIDDKNTISGKLVGGPFPKIAPPSELNWDFWLGPAPHTEYIKERCHFTFRAWYEYAGGHLTDWGVHHVDIAQWAIGMEESGPTSVEPLSFRLPVPFEKGYPRADDCYNTAAEFRIKCTFPNGVEMIICSDPGKRILFEGEKGRFFVSRGSLGGAPVERLQEEPILAETLIALRKGKPSNSHMGNFVACMRDRSLPTSDVFSHHRSATTCHLANIAMRLGRRKLIWNPETEQIVGDDEANAMQARRPRAPYLITK